MNAWRDPQLEATPPAVEQITDVLLRSGEVWIVCRADNRSFPTLAEIGLCQLPLAWPRCVGILGTDMLRLDLASFAAQVAGTAERELSESDLERSFNILTGGKERQPLTLVVDAAERLTPEVIHYIQFAVISQPTLQVIFITIREFRQRLKDFPFLGARLQPDLVVDPFSIQDPPAPHRHDLVRPDETGQDEPKKAGVSLAWVQAHGAPEIERQES